MHNLVEHILKYENWFNLIFIWCHGKADNFVEHDLEYEEWWWRNLSRRWDSYPTMWNIVGCAEMGKIGMWKCWDFENSEMQKTVWIYSIMHLLMQIWPHKKYKTWKIINNLERSISAHIYRSLQNCNCCRRTIIPDECNFGN